ncbi:MAG: hypothetical protein IT372_04530 [Polyangiaceae bacterium]|nr:hypothetical protein [Polyangiaceae bacterium]
MQVGEPANAGAGGGGGPPAPANQTRYRLRLRLGDVDEMFPAIGANDDTDAGVRRRLQAIGFLYENLTSPNIATKAADAWAHFKSIIGTRNNAAAVRELRHRVRTVIVDHGTLPARGRFRKVRVPGAYCVTDDHYNLPNNFFGAPENAGATSFRHQQERAVWTDNPSLGAIPIVARVYIKEGRKPWKRAPGVHVQFQLVDPEDPPAAHRPPALRNTTVNLTAVAPPTAMTGNPDTYVTTEKARNPPTGDHLVDNAHQSVGGKRGNAVTGTDPLQNILEVTNTRVGFHDVHSYSAAVASGNDAVAETNADGEGAVILMPAWTGGDRYRLKAFLQEDNSVEQEIGTLLVWRILRFSHYVRWNYPSGTTSAQRTRCEGKLLTFRMSDIAREYRRAWLDVIREAKAQTPQSLSTRKWRDMMTFATGRAAQPASQVYDYATLFPLRRIYGQHTCVAGDTAQSIATQYDIPDWRTIWYNRRNTALRNRRGNPNALQAGDVVQVPVGGPNPGIMNYLSQAQYDLITQPPGGPGAVLSAAGDANYWSNMSDIFFNMIAEIVHYFSKDAISGLTIIQAPGMDALYVNNVPGLPATFPWGNSGWGTSRRGCFVIFGKAAYTGAGHWMPYDHTCNALHETGHVLYGVHQYTQTPNFGTMTGSVFDEHDYHDLCIMGYMSCAGDFCGRCSLNRAGWNPRAFPANSPGP